MKRGLQKSFPQVKTRILGLLLLILLFFHAYSSLLVSAFSQEENVKDKRILQRFVQQEEFSRLSGFGRGDIPGGGNRGGRGGSPGGGRGGGIGKGNIPPPKPDIIDSGSSNCSAAKVALSPCPFLVLASLLASANN